MRILDDIRQIRVSQDISPYDKMFSPEGRKHYFYVGRSNLLTIFNVVNIRASYPGGDSDIEAILDFGCGHGRIGRWLRSGFPHAEIYVTDYDQTGVDWCVENFGCVDTRALIDVGRYDLIWLGSVFTHLPEHIVRPLLRQLLDALRPNGVLIFTTQGRYSIERMKDFNWGGGQPSWLHYNLSRDKFEEVALGYHQRDYGFTEYPGQENYGVCIAKPGWYAAQILERSDVVEILFQEKGCDNHQDVNAFMRASLTDPRKGPLWADDI